MILITGANGQTGRAVIQALAKRNANVRAFVHKPDDVNAMKRLGAREVFVGDMLEAEDVMAAFDNIQAVYHICSTANDKEDKIGALMIKVAKRAEIQHFVYHSVLHALLHNLPHHQKKLRVEEMLIDSGLPFTIVQPAAFMQNLLQSWKLLTKKGIFEQRFFAEKETRLNMLDLDDLAEAVAIILTQDGHNGATYELCGPQNLSLEDMIKVFKKQFGREIIVNTTAVDVWKKKLQLNGLSQYQSNTLFTMFQHYNACDFPGNPNVLRWILCREPHNLAEFVAHVENGKK